MDNGVFPRYPEIALLNRRPEIFSVKQVVATEKLHGSNFRLHFPCGMQSVEDIRYGSHELEADTLGEGQKFPLNRAVELFKAQPKLLTSMWETIKQYGFSDATVFGEAYGPGIKAKGVRYSTGQEMLFRAFDIMIGQNFLTYDLFCEVTDKMQLPRVHEVWRGEPSQEAFDALLEKASYEARANGIEDEANLAEGVVIRSNPLLRNVFGDWLIVKHKSKRFMEVAHAPAEVKEKGVSPSDVFASTYCTEGRLMNAVGRLQDCGVVLTNSMKDMPVLIAEILKDLHKECDPEWVATGAPEKVMLGSVSRVLGPVYRGMVEKL